MPLNVYLSASSFHFSKLSTLQLASCGEETDWTQSGSLRMSVYFASNRHPPDTLMKLSCKFLPKLAAASGLETVTLLLHRTYATTTTTTATTKDLDTTWRNPSPLESTGEFSLHHWMPLVAHDSLSCRSLILDAICHRRQPFHWSRL